MFANQTLWLIYDLIVKPSDESFDSSVSILQKEARRALMIASNAVNAAEVINIFEESGVDTKCLLVEK